MHAPHPPKDEVKQVLDLFVVALPRIETAKKAANITEPVNTWARWKELGFEVVHGSKALFSTVLIWGSRGDGATYKVSFFGLPTEYISKPLLLSYWLHLGFPEKAHLISSTISPASRIRGRATTNKSRTCFTSSFGGCGAC